MTVPHSTGDAVQFLQGWCPGGPWVLTSIVPDGGKTDTATFGTSTVARMCAWIEARQGVQNVYFTVNRTFRAMTVKFGPWTLPNEPKLNGLLDQRFTLLQFILEVDRGAVSFVLFVLGCYQVKVQ